MYFKQFYLGCLAHASYLIGSDGEAAVVDPQRDVEIYLDETRRQGLVIRHIVETHLHADFVSGHRELAGRTDAKIYFGARAGVKFEHVAVHDGDEIRVGDLVLRFLETPGHTPESICVLVYDRTRSDQPEAVLTGDTLFIGDVGRPDLLGAKMGAAELAGLLYDSLHHKILKLPDSVKVYPAHGAGSLCGRNISSDSSSTIGRERQFNYALQPMTKEEFVALMTADLPEVPPYFGMDVELNRSGPPLLESDRLPAPLSPADLVLAINNGCVVLDTRPSDQYGAGHIPDSLNIGLGGQFASWCGTLISPSTPIVIVAEDENRVREARTRLARVGLEDIAGYLSAGMRAWQEVSLPVNRTEQTGVDELQARLQGDNPLSVFDVRRPAEWKSGHIPRAVHIPLNRLAESVGAMDRHCPVAVICAGGYRSSMGTGILERLGFTHVTNVVGGMDAWLDAKLPVEV